jgi:hypothetical protein
MFIILTTIYLVKEMVDEEEEEVETTDDKKVKENKVNKFLTFCFLDNNENFCLEWAIQAERRTPTDC